MSLVINTEIEYRSFLGMDVSKSDSDPKFIQLCEDIEGDVLEYLNRDLVSQTYTDEIYCGNGAKILPLKQFPITAVTTIKQYEYETEDTYDTLTSDDYGQIWIIDQCKIQMEDLTFQEGVNNFKITYTAGYTDIPSGIKKATKELLALYFHDSNVTEGADKRLGISSKNDITYDLSPEDKIYKKLDSYRAINV